MMDVTRILNAIERGDARATDELLPVVYEELRILAAQKLSHEPPGQTLQATALVHEAYIRLVGGESQSWDSRGHFFAAAEDPFDHILGTHPTPPVWSGDAEAPQSSTAEVLHNEPWLDYNQSQTAHARWRNEYAPTVVSQTYAMSPQKPIVITEPWYELALDAPAAREIRFCAWSAIMCGAAGHSYGGGHIWLGYLPEVSRRRGAGDGSWPIDKEHPARELRGGTIHVINAPEDFPGVRQEKDWTLRIEAVCAKR